MKSKEYPSKMKFINYVVDHIEYRSNLDFDESEVSIDFDIRPEFMQGENTRILSWYWMWIYLKMLRKITIHSK